LVINRLRDVVLRITSGVGELKRHDDGTWPANEASLPTLNDAQVLKLKQLTVVALAEGASTLPYEAMMTHLEVPTVRQLEDLLINDCMYTGIVRGKLDQQKRCLEVHYAAGRDIRPGQLEKMLATLKSWTATSQQLLHTIDEKVKWAGEQSAERVKHKEALEARVEDKKKKIKVGAL
jgi:COP9 signalosome complex subunit 7